MIETVVYTSRTEAFSASVNAMPLGHAPVPPMPHKPTVPELIRQASKRHGDRPYVIGQDYSVSFADVERASRRVAKDLLAAGVAKGTRVGMLFAQNADWIITFIGISRTGAVAIPLSSYYTAAELRRALRHADVEHLIVPPTMFGKSMEDFVEETVPAVVACSRERSYFLPELPFLRSVWVRGTGARDWATVLDPEQHADPAGIDDSFLESVESEIVPADPLITLYTSGTTAEPKGIVHTHGAEVRHAINLSDFRGASPEDKVLALMPFYWIGGFGMFVLPAMHIGFGLVCQDKFDAETALDLIEREKPLTLAGWPGARQRLMDHPSYASRDLRGVVGVPLPAEPDLFTNSLGMTETSGPYTGPSAEDIPKVLPEEHRGSYGPRVPYIQHRIAEFESNATLEEGEEGEVCVKGYSLMVGMYKREREEVFDADGWYHTGDRGYFRDGLLFFTGRTTEMIKTGGSNVAPREVEVVLESFPSVRSAVVMGFDDASRGQVVVAGLVPDGDMPIDVGDVRAHARKELSSYKVPRHFVVLRPSDVPVLPTGKVDRKAVRANLERYLSS